MLAARTDAARMYGRRPLTVESVAAILRKRGLLRDSDLRELAVKGEAEKARLRKANEASRSPVLFREISETVSPAEVIAAFGFLVPGGGKRLTEDVITEAIASEAGLPYRKIDPLKLKADIVTSFLPRPFAQKHLVVQIDEKDGLITLAVADPFDIEALESLGAARKMKLELVLSSKSDILKTVREFYGFSHAVKAAQKDSAAAPDIGNLEQYVKLSVEAEPGAADRHVVSAVDYLLRYAYGQGASDIHIEPKRELSLVRLRIDGVLHAVHSVPKSVHQPIVSRIKTLSRMDIAEKRKPQDGRMKTSFMGRDMEMRVSTMPTAFGEKVVMRIFDPGALFRDIASLGFSPGELTTFASLLKRTCGIVLVTGPTGSGKTTTLYSALKSLSSPEVNIVTIEDPIEMIVDEFNQVGVQPLSGVDFAGSLRTVLRQDPDIIMVGEIRDRETASSAVQAALTGHLVLSTLHTNDAPSSVARLADLGIPPFLINSTLAGVVAQRLVRKVCVQCARQRPLSPGEAESLGLGRGEAHRVFFGEGCPECRGTGYKGRVGVFEMLEMTGRVRSAVEKGAGSDAISMAARADGFSTLRESAIGKMLQGQTTYEEVMAVT